MKKMGRDYCTGNPYEYDDGQPEPVPAPAVAGETKPLTERDFDIPADNRFNDPFSRPAPVVAAPAEGKHCANCSKLNPEYTFPCGDSYCWHCQDNRGRHDDCEKCAEAAKSWFALRASTPPTANPQWRVGKQVPLNVYEGDRPVCQCHTQEDARRIVEAVNGRS